MNLNLFKSLVFDLTKEALQSLVFWAQSLMNFKSYVVGDDESGAP
jgi:hypothetical protein